MIRKTTILVFIFIGILLGIISCQQSSIKKYKSLYGKELQNVEAYRLENSNYKGQLRQYQMTMDDLRASNDSLDVKIAQMVDELKIKDKKIEYLQYSSTTIHKTDTIHFTDTLYKSDLKLDTTLEYPWYKLEVGIRYPSELIISPTFRSERYVLIHTRKEYNKTPSKIFFIRWFQKKHKVVEVLIEEKNPYIVNNKSKFIKVLK